MQKLIWYVYGMFLVGFPSHSFTKEIAYLFAHGLSSDQSLAYYYEQVKKPDELIIIDNTVQMLFPSGKKYIWNAQEIDDRRLWIIQQPLHTFNFPDAYRGYDRSQTSLGQDNEITTLANAYEKIKDNAVVIMGMSRGASTALNFLATRNPQSVVAAIVESPFDSILNTLDTHCGQLWLGLIPSLLHTCPNVLFGKFNRYGIFPINVIEKIDKNIPILIIASLQDKLIPAFNSASLYLKFLEHNHPHVYFLLLDYGQHAYLLEDDDAPFYFNTVHAFYKKYNLPYNKIMAEQGEDILTRCQPSKKIVEQALKNKKSYITYINPSIQLK